MGERKLYKCKESIKFHTKSYKWKESNKVLNSAPYKHVPHKKNSKVKSPFRRFWMRPVMSRMCPSLWMTCVRNLEKHVLDPVWLFDDQKSWFRHSFLKSKTDSDVFGNLTKWKPESVWDKHDQPLPELNLCLYVLKSLIFWRFQRQFWNLSLATVAALWLVLVLILLIPVYIA